MTPGRVVKPGLGTTSMSFSLLAWGAGEISGGALAGWFYDALESYDYSFYTAGSVMTAGSGFMLVIFFLQRAKQRCHIHPAKISEGRHEHVNPLDLEFDGSKVDDVGRVNPLFFVREKVESKKNEGEAEAVEDILSVEELNEREIDSKLSWYWNSSINSAPEWEDSRL
ncbi:uncharacterized protein LOC110978937 [Acanthaster planci]|uniref:Uncharacterized protein LOC110978937 n=1 Tax=Acanthaster planci TaxID=133434 RepID=A0A8B7Y9R9_ACAPL|nr:uncharacterized protein LOC110978937 [Acanthaster planci]